MSFEVNIELYVMPLLAKSDTHYKGVVRSWFVILTVATQFSRLKKKQEKQKFI